jgi:hypothetical protein
MANGCNIGPDTMAQLTPKITYQHIKRITDWQLTQETQRSALAAVVNAIGNLSITLTWGEGKTSASDGQRFAFRRKVPSLPTTMPHITVYRLSAMTVMHLMCLTVSFIMKATYNWKNITPILMDTQRLILPHLRCLENGSALVYVKFLNSESTELIQTESMVSWNHF